jgi:hypothetical protein
MPTITRGSTHRFQLTATKDGAVWDLTGATVTLFLIDTLGAETSYTATISSPSGGVAYYDVATSVLTQAGTWSRAWRIVQSGVTMWSVRTGFDVVRGA